MADFDHIAKDYDSIFTDSQIGKLQRKYVWSYLENYLSDKEALDILELNCGTGEDAMWFARHGHQVLATDISPEMVLVTRQKADSSGVGDLVDTAVYGFEDLLSVEWDQRFDLIFSNFGGLNCVDSEVMALLGDRLSRFLRGGGSFIGVIMPEFCLWESAYFMSKLKLGDAFRRSGGKPVIAQLHGGTVKTWYYSPKKIKNLWKPSLNYIDQRPIGIALAPSYLEPFFIKRKSLLSWLDHIEGNLGGMSFLAGFGDHYLIRFEG